MSDVLQSLNSWASQHTALVNMILTAFLVYLTAWYATVTRRMWREMVESRISAIRPILRAKLRPGIRLEHEGDPRRAETRSDLEVKNYGRGHAFGTKGTASSKYVRGKDRSRLQISLDLPTQFAPGQEATIPCRFLSADTKLNESDERFLDLEIDCADAEGNRYALEQVYDLHVTDIGTAGFSRVWLMRSEKVCCGPDFLDTGLMVITRPARCQGSSSAGPRRG